MSSSQAADRNSAPTGNQSHISCQLVICRLDELHPHPSYVRHRCSVSAAQLSALAALGDLAFREPIVITHDRRIIDGYARWQLARQQGLATILCIEHELAEEEALRWLIRSHRPSRGLNSYGRVLLALDLEPALQERARAKQQAGGQNKGSSILTEGQRLDVRSEIAAVVGVSTGNVTKVKRLRKTVHPRVEQAVRTGEISIHKAWQWSPLSAQQQLRELELYQGQRGTNKTSRQLIRKHAARRSSKRVVPPSLASLLKPFLAETTPALDSIIVTEIDSPGKIAYLTKDAWQTLQSLKE